MKHNFAQILQRLPRGDRSTSKSYFGSVTPFKVQVNFDIPIFEGQIDANVIDKWLNLLEGYFFVHDFSGQEKITFTLLKATPHVKNSWKTHYKQKDESMALLSPQETLVGCISEMLGNITNSTKMLENGG